MATMTLYSGPLSMFGAKAQVAALEKGLTFELVMVPFTDDHRYEPKHPEVLRVNPECQVPVLVHGEVEIFDSTQIFEYLEDIEPLPALWPRAPALRARARLMELKSDEIFFPHVIRLMGLQDRIGEAPATDAIAQLDRYYDEMNAVLNGREFLAGEYSFADIAFFMAQLFAARLGAPMPPGVSRLTDWRRRIAARDAVTPVLAQFASTLGRAGRPIPEFMSEAISGRSRGRDSV